MSESRVFVLNGIGVQAVATRLENFFRSEKGMEVQSSQTTDGYVMQASQPKDGWKTLTGMRLAVTVQMTVMENHLNVTVGEGQWSDKIGAGAIGLFIAWPLAITAGMGAFKQKKLPAEIFQVIENCIMTGGQPVVVNGAGTAMTPGMMLCPNCHTQIPNGSKFCNHCGTKINNKCPNCGADIIDGSAFCADCGQKL
ncbi:zinc ribbon domain-containing protein [Oscillospiraceae bacterium LCP25S3_E10]|nr:zinc ribbon domain-containing protein [Ruminococcus sp.]MDD6446592.1 zinc ribbon domain-containing protein [Ruminococcus sp.]MDY2856074.1 zinc ribbon domain-containing protein [Oscillospiraceae bacterium]